VGWGVGGGGERDRDAGYPPFFFTRARTEYNRPSVWCLGLSTCALNYFLGVRPHLRFFCVAARGERENFERVGLGWNRASPPPPFFGFCVCVCLLLSV
jgi:hypothetical protein